jgi:hypothetical protein
MIATATTAEAQSLIHPAIPERTPLTAMDSRRSLSRGLFGAARNTALLGDADAFQCSTVAGHLLVDREEIPPAAG